MPSDSRLSKWDCRSREKLKKQKWSNPQTSGSSQHEASVRCRKLKKWFWHRPTVIIRCRKDVLVENTDPESCKTHDGVLKADATLTSQQRKFRQHQISFNENITFVKCQELLTEKVPSTDNETLQLKTLRFTVVGLIRHSIFNSQVTNRFTWDQFHLNLRTLMWSVY